MTGNDGREMGGANLIIVYVIVGEPWLFPPSERHSFPSLLPQIMAVCLSYKSPELARHVEKMMVVWTPEWSCDSLRG